MRIAIVINTSWNIYNFRQGLIRSFLNDGHEVIAIAPKDNYSERLSSMGCKYYPVSMDSRGVNPFKDLALTVELFRIYRKVKPDVILHFTVKPNIYGTMAASLLKIPVVNNVCGLGTAFIRKGLVTKIVQTLYRISFRYSNKVFFQNWEDCRLFTDNGVVRQELTEVIPGSGIDVARFSPRNKKRKDGMTFLMVSRIIRDKGVLEYIDAIQQVKDKYPWVNFQLLGQKDPHHKHGIDPSLVDQWAKDGLIDYLGTTDDVREHITEADCIVLPSYREGTPRTLLEAASMARPIITTDTAGCNSVVQDGFNGLLCKVKDSDDLAGRISEIIEMSENERTTMGKNGRDKMVNEYGESLVIERYQATINTISS